MTRIVLKFLLFGLIVFSNVEMKAEMVLRNSVQLNKTEKLLIAPLSTTYEWYLNNTRLDVSSQQIKLMKAGTYKVIMKDEEGNSTSANIKVAFNAVGEVFKIFTIGDSTVQNYTDGWYPKKGWGQVLQYFFDSNVTVDNRAAGGTSSKSFYNSFWAGVKADLDSGDYVFIQFGINDRNKADPNRYAPYEEFKDYLRMYVAETQEKGAFPILVSTVRRNAWVDDFTVYDSYHEHPVATREVAAELNVPLVDLNLLEKNLMESLGPAYVGPYMYMFLDPGEYPSYSSGQADQVHLQEMGAIDLARLVANELKKFEGDSNLNKLIPHLKPLKKVEITSNFPDGINLITRDAEFPEGVTVTLKLGIKSEYAFMHWADNDSNSLSDKMLYTFKMDTNEHHIIAMLDDDPYKDCMNVVYGKAYIDTCGACVGGTSPNYPCTYSIEEDTFKIVVQHEKRYCLEDKGDHVTQEVCIETDAQLWSFKKEGLLYRITSVSSGNDLSVESDEIRTLFNTTSPSRFWRIENYTTKLLQIANPDSVEFVAEIAIGSAKAGTDLRLNTRLNKNWQKFVIYEKDKSPCSYYKPSCVSVSKVYLNDQFKIVSNPTNSNFTITFDTKITSTIDVRIYNMSGKLVLEKTNITDSSIRFGDQLPKGIYIGKIKMNDVEVPVKLVKN